MLDLENISPAEAWTPDPDTVLSFCGGYQACRLHGPARLVRLLAHAGQAPEGQFYGANRTDGAFWLAETDYERLRQAALADLAGQADGGRSGTRLGLYLRLQLRDLLAIRRDWTPSFDYLAPLQLPRGASVVALVGRIRRQPVYSPGFAGAEGAARAGIDLPGGLTQYVINFQFPANQGAVEHIGPLRSL